MVTLQNQNLFSFSSYMTISKFLKFCYFLPTSRNCDHSFHVVKPIWKVNLWRFIRLSTYSNSLYLSSTCGTLYLQWSISALLLSTKPNITHHFCYFPSLVLKSTIFSLNNVWFKRKPILIAISICTVFKLCFWKEKYLYKHCYKFFNIFLTIIKASSLIRLL